MILYSVIIPVYNKEKYITKTLESLKSHDQNVMEVIIVNDGSTDASIDIINKFFEENPFENITIVSQENKGVSAARNYGLRLAQGTYILFVDGDDESIGKKLKSNFNKYSQDLMLCDYYQNGKPINKKAFSRPFTCISREKFIVSYLPSLLQNELFNSTCNKIYKLSIIKDHGIEFNEETSMGEDLLFNIRYLDHVNTIIYLDSLVIYNYLNNEESLTQSFNPKKYVDLDIALEEISAITAGWNDKEVTQAVNFLYEKRALSEFKNLAKNGRVKKLKYRELMERLFDKDSEIITVKKNVLKYMPKFLATYLIKKV